MNTIGPFPMRVVLVAVAVLAGLAMANFLARRRGIDDDRQIGRVLLDMVLIGLFAARLGYVLRWWPDYVAAPMSMLALGDGGFLAWLGVPLAALFGWWRLRHQHPLRAPMLVGLVAAVLVWLALDQSFARLSDAAPPLPELNLVALDGTPVALREVAAGRPTVVNLWATWCPPCRREMPVFAHAQKAWPELNVLLVNEGDEAFLIEDYLRRSGVEVRGVLRDPDSRLMQTTGARVLPTTLFYDANGHLVDTHVGELTRAALTDRLRRRFGAQAVP